MTELANEQAGLSEAERADVQQRWRDDLTDSYDQIIGVVKAALAAKRKVRVQRECAKCHCKHIEYVEIDDVDAAIKAAEFLSNRALGRPAARQDDRDEERIVFQRLVEFPKEMFTAGYGDGAESPKDAA